MSLYKFGVSSRFEGEIVGEVRLLLGTAIDVVREKKWVAGSIWIVTVLGQLDRRGTKLPVF